VSCFVLPQRSTRHRGRRERRQQRQAAWMFLIACVFVFGFMFLFGPDELVAVQHRALGVSYSILVGFLGYFTCGSTKIVAESEISTFSKVLICLIVAALAATSVVALWEMGISPVSRSEG
jgi:Mn2+/Fe2+ NRAMP family transporter